MKLSMQRLNGRNVIVIIDELEQRLIELQKTLKDIKIKWVMAQGKTIAETIDIDYLQMQTYVLGFQEAMQIALKSLREVKNDNK